MDSSEYQVTIKSANQKVDDYVTRCRPSWTVLRLKQHISQTHINKPTVKEQRLIYAGNLLKDSHTLKQIFFRDSLCTELTNSSKTDFTIHLVCSSHIQKLSSNPTTGQSATPSSSAMSPVLASSLPSSTSNVGSGARTNQSTSVDSSSNNGQTQQAPGGGYIPATNSNPSHVGQSTDSGVNPQGLIQNMMQSDQMREQMAVFQQLALIVAAQIASNVTNNTANRDHSSSVNELNNQATMFTPIATNQTLNIQISTTSSSDPLSTAIPQMVYATRQPNQFVPTDGHEPRAGQVHQNENINNENNGNGRGAGEPPRARYGIGVQVQAPAPVVEQPAPRPDQEVPIQHDVIDWIYYSVRAVVLMAALYIHASVLRLLFIIGLLCIAYVLNRRSTRRAANTRQEPIRPPQDLNAAEAPRPDPNQVNVDRVNQALDNEENRAINGDALPNQEQEGTVPGRVPFLKLCYLVVTDFLASLVPE